MSRGFHSEALRVALGLFCLLLGALMLVAPHKFEGATYNAVRFTMPVIGVALITGGMMLAGTMVLGLGRIVFFAAHALAAAPGNPRHRRTAASGRAGRPDRAASWPRCAALSTAG